MSETTWNQSNTRIVVDSACNVPAHLRDQYGMIEVPILVNWGEESFRDNVDLKPDVFYERFAEIDVVPTTSQPPPRFFADAYRQAFDQGARHVVVVTISSKLSGTYASSQTALQSLGDIAPDYQGIDDERFLFWDGDSISMGCGWQAVAAARLLETGIERDALIERLAEIRSEIIGFATLDTLKHAARSGRVSNLQASIGNLLHVKAILEINDGLVIPVGRARGRKRSLRDIVGRICDRFQDEPVRAAFFHAVSEHDASTIAAMVQERLTVDEMYIGDIGPAIASYGGEGAIGLVAYPSRLG